MQQAQRLLIGVIGLGLACWTPSTQAHREMLLDVSHGQKPSSTGSNQILYSLGECQELGAAALKVQFPPGDSFGDQSAKISNWQPFTHLEFSVFNPAAEPVTLALNIKHQQTNSYSMGVDLPLSIRPGRQDVKLSLASLLNTDGSAPNLASVSRWYFANTTGKPATLFFGDISLVGADQATPLSGNLTIDGGVLPPGKVFHLRGSLNGQPVNLTVTSDTPAPTGPAASAPVLTSPQPSTAAATPESGSRTRGKMPEIQEPILFNTPAADAILKVLEVFPPDNPWNLAITDWPVHPNSRNIIASIGAEKPLRYNPDMAFVIVPPDQQRQPVRVSEQAESDKGPFPVAANTPIEGWPSAYRGEPQTSNLTLDEVQRDTANLGGDRHGILVDPVNRILYEFWQLKKTDQGWQASQASIFDLKTNKLRPNGWTSADAAGLPIFPSIVRYDELKRGDIEHALRVTVKHSRRAHVAPATHYASKLTDVNLPRMGERIRLRGDFNISGFSPEVQTILKALQTYGMFVADNGMDWAISVTPDERIPALHEQLRRVHGSDFEVVTPP